MKKTAAMEDRERNLATRAISRRIEKKGLRPRLAAAVIAGLWLATIVVFGIAQHLVDPTTFDNVWLGMWWATQTVTTVGYGDVVPDQTAGKALATVLMIGGLSFFAVITGSITSIFITRAQERRRHSADDPVLRQLAALTAELEAVRQEVAGLARPSSTDGPQRTDES